jgi:CRP-like cAMP-binding protein
LNFLLPGDVFSIKSIFESRVHYSVKALTDTQIKGMRRVEVQSRLLTGPLSGRVLAKLCSDQEEAADGMLAAVAHGPAEERIAHLLLQLMTKIAAQSVVKDNSYLFPLRQQHIADAVGLTHVHVSRILSAFRERGILSLSSGLLRVFDLRELERLGSLR